MEVSKPHQKGHGCCCSPAPAIVSGIVFLIIAIMDVVRLIAGWQVTVNGYVIPTWATILCALIAAALAAWNLIWGCCKKCHEGRCKKPPPPTTKAL